MVWFLENRRQQTAFVHFWCVRFRRCLFCAFFCCCGFGEISRPNHNPVILATLSVSFWHICFAQCVFLPCSGFISGILFVAASFPGPFAESPNGWGPAAVVRRMGGIPGRGYLEGDTACRGGSQGYAPCRRPPPGSRQGLRGTSQEF